MKANTKMRLWWTDIPDPDVIRVNDTYYMSSTTMHFTPGCPIMKSKDLQHWEIVNYVYDILEETDMMALKNGKHDYGRGSWASCLRYANDTFYITFAAYNANKTYIFQTKDIEGGKWERYSLEGVYHDLSLLFDDNDKVYLVYGGGNIRVVELQSDARSLKINGLNKSIIPQADVGGKGGLPAEGSHIYKLNGMYYIFLIAWPPAPLHSGRRIQICYRSEKIDGEYEGKVIFDYDLGFYNRGIAQGGIFDTEDGDWYSMMFQDHGSVGRIPVLVPFRWVDGWPVFDNYENISDDPSSYSEFLKMQDLVRTDDFDNTVLSRQWQWNHNSDQRNWTLSDRPGWMKLKNGIICHNLSDAHNTLTQRTFGPACSGRTRMDISEMRNGDFAGLAAFQDQYGYAGVMIKEQKAYIVMGKAAPEPFDPANMVYELGRPEVIAECIPLDQKEIFLRVDMNFTSMEDTAEFYYSLDSINWNKIGEQLNMTYRLTHFVGYRFALFSYATIVKGGSVSFDYFEVNKMTV